MSEDGLSAGNAAALDGYKIDLVDDGKKEPKVAVNAAPADDAKAGAKIIKQGSGETIKQGQQITLYVAGFDGKSGKGLENSGYSASAKPVVYSEATYAQQMPDFGAVLKNAKVGADIAYYVPASTTGSTSQLLVVHLADASDPKIAWKKSTEDAPSELTVEQQGEGYSITIPKGDAPKELQKKVLKEGTEGKAATASSKVTAKYAGAQWSNGVQFDGNFDAAAGTEFPLNGVIKGWTQGLDGYKAGTVVALTIPADLAYGDQEGTGRPTGPLVFLVEIEKVS